MPQGYSCVCVTVCLSVTTLAATYLISTSQMKIHTLLWHFQDFIRVAFAENALFKSCGVIFLPSNIVGFLTRSRMGKRNSDGFFSTILFRIAADLHTNVAVWTL